MSKKSIPTIVIERSDNDLSAVTADQPVRVVEIDHTSDLYEESVKTHKGDWDNLQIVPADVEDLDNVEGGGTYDSYDSVVDKSYVNGLTGFIDDDASRKRFNETAMLFFQEQEEDESEQEDE